MVRGLDRSHHRASTVWERPRDCITTNARPLWTGCANFNFLTWIKQLPLFPDPCGNCFALLDCLD